jgi:hypothetical protein
MRVTGMLANVSVNVDELARLSRVDVDDVQTMVNALSLVGVLEGSSDPGPQLTSSAVVDNGEPDDTRNSFFSKLRSRLGL